MNKLTEAVVTIATAIVGVAILAVLVSQKSNTPAVLQAAGGAFSSALGAATGPVTGGGGPAGLQMTSPLGGGMANFGGIG